MCVCVYTYAWDTLMGGTGALVESCHHGISMKIDMSVCMKHCNPRSHTRPRGSPSLSVKRQKRCGRVPPFRRITGFRRVHPLRRSGYFVLRGMLLGRLHKMDTCMRHVACSANAVSQLAEVACVMSRRVNGARRVQPLVR